MCQRKSLPMIDSNLASNDTKMLSGWCQQTVRGRPTAPLKASGLQQFPEDDKTH